MKYVGKYDGDGLKVAIVVSRFNEIVTSKLLSGAEDSLSRSGVAKEDIDVFWVPGAFEIPFLIKKIIKNNNSKYDGILSLGAVIRGETSHYDLVTNEASKGIAHVGLSSDIPIMFGVVTTETMEQAIDRAGGKSGNKGFEIARDLIEMATLNKNIDDSALIE